MTVTQPLSNTREDSRDITEQSTSDRIRTLAAQGLKVRDICSLLGLHPLLVLRVLNENAQHL